MSNNYTWNISLPKKRVLIDQPLFLGDIIFVMAIAQKYANEGHIVDFPLENEYYDIPIQKYFPNPNINYMRMEDFSEYKNYDNMIYIEDDKYIYLPLSESWRRVRFQQMGNKYTFIGLPIKMWRDVKIIRDYKRENKLFNKLGLIDGDKYNLINEHYRKALIKVPISVNNGYKNIFMKKIDDYSLFDWIGVMQRAQSIHTIGTSILFIMDLIENMPADMHVYKRNDGKLHDVYDYLYIKKYIYH